MPCRIPRPSPASVVFIDTSILINYLFGDAGFGRTTGNSIGCCKQPPAFLRRPQSTHRGICTRSEGDTVDCISPLGVSEQENQPKGSFRLPRLTNHRRIPTQTGCLPFAEKRNRESGFEKLKQHSIITERRRTILLTSAIWLELTLSRPRQVIINIIFNIINR